MNSINFREHRARRLVDRLFKANSTRRGQICDWPVVGGHYVSGEEPIRLMREMREKAVRAVLAREYFALNGPPECQPLPLSYDEREDMKGRGLLNYIGGKLYARSLEGRDYDVKEHPPCSDYISGVLWEAERVDRIGVLPNDPGQLADLKKRYPPAKLAGIGPGFCWLPPKLHAQTMASYRRSRARSGSRRRKSSCRS
jgi:hypothetical protein